MHHDVDPSATRYGHGKPLAEWEVLLKDHHEGYIDWAEFERNQKQLAVNNYAHKIANHRARSANRQMFSRRRLPSRGSPDGELVAVHR